MNKKSLIEKVQDFLSGPIAFVLGSGCSAHFGLPTSSEITSRLLSDPIIQTMKSFSRLSSALKVLPLEEAIVKSRCDSAFVDRMRIVVWKAISEKDLELFHELRSGRTLGGLGRLIDLSLETSSQSALIVTTNYDRIPEYLADKYQAEVIDGLSGQYQLWSSAERTYDWKTKKLFVWKVHGSLDWYKAPDASSVYRIPLQNQIPTWAIPLIVPPSNAKYEETAEFPYRAIIEQADAAFKKSSCFLCIGYGFGDKHIQPILIEELQKGRPLVCLTKSITESALRILTKNSSHYLIFECGKEPGQTRILSSEKLFDNQVIRGNYWDVDVFAKEIFDHD